VSDILDLLEDASYGLGTVRFLPDHSEPRPVSDLWRLSAAAARWIAQRAGSEATIAGVLNTSPGAIAALIGAWRAGTAFASLPNPGRALSVERYVQQTVEMCKLAGAGILLVGEATRAMVPELPLQVFTFEEVCAYGGSSPARDAGHTRLIQFTSGSTARPKGVELTGAAIAANITAILERLEVGAGDTCCSWLPLAHDMGLIGLCLSALVASSSRIADMDLVLMAPEYFLAQPTTWLQVCSDVGSTITGAPNFALRMVTRNLTSSPDLSRLRALITGAERVGADTLRSFERAYESLSPTALCPAYGLAEASLAVTMVRPQDRWSSLTVDSGAMARHEWSEASDGTELVSNGRAIPRMGVRVRGGGDGIDRIEVGGPSLLDRYVGAELQVTGDGWFPTADLGHVCDGELFVAGRADDLIIVGGRNYYAFDLEACVCHPLVRPGNVAALPTDDGSYLLVAEVRGSPSQSELKAAAREIRALQVRRSGIAPVQLVFVSPRTLPKTPSGKLQRHRVQAALAASELPVEYRLESSSR
jgi:acyl-CoA synthetase (AMP-forming)/AMP-acid ligase II